MRCSKGRRLYSSRLSRCKITCGPYIVAAEERMMRNGPERRIGSHGLAGAAHAAGDRRRLRAEALALGGKGGPPPAVLRDGVHTALARLPLSQ